MMRIERALFKDMGHLTNAEIATQEYPLTQDELKPYVMEKGFDAYMALLSGRMVGYALVRSNKEKSYSQICSVGIYPKFRRVGFGSRLVAKACLDAYIDGFERIRMYVPSYTIEDRGDPWNVEHWCWRNEFKAVGTLPGCFRYGREYDWYIMERQLNTDVRKQAAQAVNTPT